jgi:hypothetical protein
MSLMARNCQSLNFGELSVLMPQAVPHHALGWYNSYRQRNIELLLLMYETRFSCKSSNVH